MFTKYGWVWDTYPPIFMGYQPFFLRRIRGYEWIYPPEKSNKVSWKILQKDLEHRTLEVLVKSVIWVWRFVFFIKQNLTWQ